MDFDFVGCFIAFKKIAVKKNGKTCTVDSSFADITVYHHRFSYLISIGFKG